MYLDVVGSIDERVALVRIDAADGKEGVALGEQVLFVQVGAGELEGDRILVAGVLLAVDRHQAHVTLGMAEGQQAPFHTAFGRHHLGQIGRAHV